MAKFAHWLKIQFGPSPLIGLCMLVMMVLSIMAAFRITPSLPAWLGYTVLVALVATGCGYCAVGVMRLWPQVAGGPDSGPYRRRRRSQLRTTDSGMTGVPALDELMQMTGLDTVKAEIATLIHRLRVETARQDRGLPVAPISLHMVFAGPPGVGKTRVARLH